MLVKDISTKRLLVFSLAVMLVIASATFMSACHRSKGGGGVAGPVEPPPPPPPDPGQPPAEGPVNFTTTQQAVNGFPAVQGARTVADTQFSLAMLLVGESRPAGFAPGVDKGAIAALDPELASMTDGMEKLARSPLLTRAASKARAFRTQTVAPTTFTADMCPGGGSLTISGTNNLDDVNALNLISSYTISYADCKDDVLFTQLTGTLTVDQTENVSTAALATAVAADLTQTTFADATLATALQTARLSNSFSDSDQGATGERTATGSFTMSTVASAATTTYAWNDLRDRRTNTTDTAGHLDEEHAITGSVNIATASRSLSMTMALEDVWHHQGDAEGTRLRTIEGTVDVSWSPDLSASGCIPGRLTITMPNATDILEYKAATGYTCPVSGTVSANNSTITYGAPIQIAVGGSLQTFADCNALNTAAQVCGY